MKITGSIWKSVKGYLSDRYHFVSVDGGSSEHLKILLGLPQSSVLGPLLFIVYINDLLSSISSAIPLMFADDTKNSSCYIMS